MVRGVDDEGIVAQAATLQRVQHLADHGVHPCHERPVCRSRPQHLVAGNFGDAALLAPPPQVWVNRISEGLWAARHGYRAPVLVVVRLSGDVWLVGQHEAQREGEGLGLLTGRLAGAHTVDEVYGRADDVLVMDLVGALAVTGRLQADAMGPGRAGERSVVYRRAASVVGPVIADEALGEPVQLVWAIEVEPAHLHGAVPGSAHGVGHSGNGRVQHVHVRPDAVLERVASREQGAAGGHADGGRAVGAVHDHAAGCQPVQVGGLRDRVAVASRHGGAMLVRLDEEDVGACVLGHQACCVA